MSNDRLNLLCDLMTESISIDRENDVMTEQIGDTLLGWTEFGMWLPSDCAEIAEVLNSIKAHADKMLEIIKVLEAEP